MFRNILTALVLSLGLSTTAMANPTSQDPAKVRITIAREGADPATTTLADLKAGTVEDVVIQGGDVITISIDP